MNDINVLFLDLDGVINNSNLYDADKHDEIPQCWDQYYSKLVANIREIIHTYNFKVVISSTWRQNYDLIMMDAILNNLWYLDCEIIGYTTTDYLDTDYRERIEWDPTSESRNRGLQITDWLKNNQDKNIKKYVVIDDDIDAKYGHEDNFFKVDVMTGFDNKHLEMFHKFMWKKYAIKAVDLKEKDIVKCRNGTKYTVITNIVGEVLFLCNLENTSRYEGVHLYYGDSGDELYGLIKFGVEL